MKSLASRMRRLQRQRGGDAADHVLVERAPQPHQRLVAAGAVDDQLGDHASRKYGGTV
jgi:hypothetical protein